MTAINETMQIHTHSEKQLNSQLGLRADGSVLLVSIERRGADQPASPEVNV